MRIKLLIEYDGTNFCGWQKQKEQNSVQETIEKAIKKVFNNCCEIELYGSGRTDAGVHAKGQVAHFEISNEKLIQRWQNELRRLPLSINAFLQNSGISIISATEVSKTFHARFSATMRHYQYIILNRTAKSPLNKNRVWHVKTELNVEKMNEASKLLTGFHDFNSFRSTQCTAPNSKRTINNIEVFKENDFIITNISAKSFLHNQVRIIIGTLKDIGAGKISKDYINFLLKSKDRTLSGTTAPPFGLYFFKVDY